ncbi:hypothetical protein SAMN04488092_116104 [Thalassovita taeanensis]|uniref:Uncharacterized protein n=1 Tax=Thalassovita taeanensis TaxID=657014 RepID=A0A1H9K0D2_9RHOB|nr:hypothetical protein SAMN04488092_116104 [Thalassovita taeanensis]
MLRLRPALPTFAASARLGNAKIHTMRDMALPILHGAALEAPIFSWSLLTHCLHHPSERLQSPCVSREVACASWASVRRPRIRVLGIIHIGESAGEISVNDCAVECDEDVENPPIIGVCHCDDVVAVHDGKDLGTGCRKLRPTLGKWAPVAIHRYAGEVICRVDCIFQSNCWLN